jgi:hypothetical protein
MPGRSGVMSALLAYVHRLLNANGRSGLQGNLGHDRLKWYLVGLFPVNLCAAVAAEEAAWRERGSAQIA